MLTNEKIRQTRKLISKGVPEGEIKNQLRAEGYSEEDIQKIFAPRPYDMRSWLLTSAILLCLFGLYLFFTGKTMLLFDNDNSMPLMLFVLAGLLFAEYLRLQQKINKKNQE